MIYSTRVEHETRRDALAASRAILERKFEALQQRVQAAKLIANSKARRVEQIACQLALDELRQTEASLTRLEQQRARPREVR